MSRRPARPPDEGTARFIYQGAVGVGLVCVLASLVLGFRQEQLGAAVFLGLALLSLAAVVYFGRRYAALRRVRWTRELDPQQAALDRLFDQARPVAPAPPAEEDAPDG